MLYSEAIQAVHIYETPLKFYDQIYWIKSFVSRHSAALVIVNI